MIIWHAEEEGGDINVEHVSHGDDEDDEHWDPTWIFNGWFAYKLFESIAPEQYRTVLLLIDKGFDKEAGKKGKMRAQAWKKKVEEEAVA